MKIKINQKYTINIDDIFLIKQKKNDSIYVYYLDSKGYENIAKWLRDLGTLLTIINQYKISKNKDLIEVIIEK